MRIRPLYALAVAGVLLGLISAYVLSGTAKPNPPLFKPAADPFTNGIYANGIIESDQAEGQNVSLYPEVSGVVARIFVREGQAVTAGAPLIALDDSIQRATSEQLSAQVAAQQGALDEMRAMPRRENLEVAAAQVESAKAALATAGDAYDKQQAAWKLDSAAVSRDALDSARDARAVAAAALKVAERQYQLMQAGTWSYDLRNQERQLDASQKGLDASKAVLAKYVIRAPVGGTILAINTAQGNYMSPQGAYDSYTQGFGPAVVMGGGGRSLAVRVYVDEVLVQRLPAPGRIAAEMSIRGTGVRIPLRFVRVQPLVSPKIQLSDQRQERVDVRVLPLIFRFRPPAGLTLYPGQLVDVYIGESGAGQSVPPRKTAG